MADYKSLLSNAKYCYDQKESSATSDTKDKELKWVLNTIKTGTFSDRLSALALLVQKAPKTPLRPLRMLLALAKKNGVRVSELAILTMKELFNSTLLKDEKLRYFSPNANQEMKEDDLVELYKDDGIKGIYSEYLNCINDRLVNSLEHTKKILVQVLVDLIISHPEQEEVILSILTNRIGVEEGNLGKLCSQGLRKLLSAHPNMSLIVCKLLEQHISRADNMSKGTLRCIKIMSTISAHSKNMEAKGFLFKLFHNMFKRISSLENRKNALKSTKLLNLIISGIENTMEGQSLDETTTDIYRVAYTSNIKTRVDSLKLIYSMCKAKQEFPKKYYNCLYDILREPELSKSSSLEDMFELLYKSLKVDTKLDRTVSVIKRLLQKALVSGTDFIVASLLLLSKLSQSNKLLHQWIITKELNLCEKEVFVDVGEENTNEEARILYDSQKRDCEFTKAYDSNLWELDALSRHQHPRVRQMVQSIIEGTYEKYDGNPLLDFKGINFLDKISYKNPKKLKRFFKGRSSNTQQPLNLVQLEDLNTDESMVFYKYFTTKQKLLKDKKKGHKVPAPQVSKEQQEPQDEEAELDDFLKGEIKKKKMYDGTE